MEKMTKIWAIVDHGSMRELIECYNELEKLMEEYEQFYEGLDIAAKIMMAQAYFLLAVFYFYRDDAQNRDLYKADNMNVKSLMTFKDCNVYNQRFQQCVQMASNEEQVVRMDTASISIEDLQLFWPYIFQNYILRMFVDCALYVLSIKKRFLSI